MYVVDLKTRTHVSLGRGNFPSYSPNGKRITYTVKMSFASIGRVGVANSSGGARRTLNLSSFIAPVWSPDSAEVVGPEFANLVVIRADATRRRIVAVDDVLWLEWVA